MRKRFMVLAAAGAMVLTGCSQMPNTAATVDGQRITETEVTAATEQLTEVLGTAPETSLVANILMQEKLLAVLMAERGVEVSDDEAIAYLQSAADSYGTQPPEDLADSTIAIGRYDLLVSEASASEDVTEISEEFVAELTSDSVQVSPRYGEYDDSGSLVTVTPEWLATVG